MSLPIALVNQGLPKTVHGWLYLPIVLVGFIFMIPAIIYGEKKQQLKRVFVLSIALMLVAQLIFLVGLNSLTLICTALVVYFVAFNILEATLPSLVSKFAPTAAKGTAMGVYNTAQSLGLFAGGAGGGVIFNQFGFFGVFVFCAVLMTLWLILAITAKHPPAAKNVLFSLSEVWQNHALSLKQSLQQHYGILEVALSEDNTTLYLKIMQNGADETQSAIEQLLSGAPNERQ